MASLFRYAEKFLVISGLQILFLATQALTSDSTSTYTPLYTCTPGRCPPGSEIVYSPFTPGTQSKFASCNDGNTTPNPCWWWAICTFTEADEARKQQFAAVSLVMGLVPLTLKDIAWPERRIVLVSQRPRKLIEVIIRALGIVPSIPKSTNQEKEAISTTKLYASVRKLSRTRIMLFAALSAVILALSYAALAVIEIYSKRSSIGCPYPIFILTWHLLAIVPAGIETVFRQRLTGGPSRHVMSQATTKAGPSTTSSVDVEHNKQPEVAAIDDPSSSSSSAATPSAQVVPKDDNRDISVALNKQLGSSTAVQQGHAIPVEDTSAIQGRGQPWPIQFIWSIYYIAGTLFYSSIMAVTVIELFAWVMTSVAVAAASKFLGFLLCMVIEKKWELARIH